jgi:energy-coupling factor transporter ATP-binding protein EcfA2
MKSKMHLWGNLPEVEPRRELVEGLIAAGEVCFLTGRPGAGKSAVAAALATAVVSGRPFLRRKTRRVAAVYVAAERGRVMPARFRAAGLPPVGEDFPDGNPVQLSLRQSTLRIIDDLPELIREIRETVGHPGLIVIDTLARVSVGLKENDSGDASAVADALARLTEEFRGAAVVVVHHLGKDGDFRGSTAFLGAADLELRVVTKAAGMRLKVAKSNNIDDGLELPFQLEAVKVDGGETAVRAVSPRDPADALKDGNAKRRNEASARAIEALPHLPTGGFKVSEVIDTLTDAGVIDGKDRRTRRTKAERLLKKLTELGKVDELDGQYTISWEG